LSRRAKPAAIHWEPQRRIPSLDALRGIAALAVVVHHAALQRLPIVRHAVFMPDVNVFSPVLFWMGTWGVTLFFVLSGFCIHLPQARKEHEGSPFIGWREFYRRRARRLLPTHYASLALAVIAAYFFPTDLISRATIGTLLAHVFMVHTWVSSVFFHSINAVFWSIAVEVHFYLAYPLLQWIRKRLGYGLVAALLGIALFVYLIGFLRPPGNFRFVVQGLFLVTWWQWGLGVVLADIYVRGRIASVARFVVFPGALWVWGGLSLAVAYADPTVAGAHIRFWLFPVICAAVLLSAAIGHTRAHGARPLEWLGDFSYSLYLIHPVALAIMIRVLPQGVLPGALSGLIDIVASVGLSRAFFYLVERHFLNTPPRAQPK